jgi:hypothetical protein
MYKLLVLMMLRPYLGNIFWAYSSQVYQSKYKLLSLQSPSACSSVGGCSFLFARRVGCCTECQLYDIQLPSLWSAVQIILYWRHRISASHTSMRVIKRKFLTWFWISKFNLGVSEWNQLRCKFS